MGGREGAAPAVSALAKRRGNPANLMWGVLEGCCLWFYVNAHSGFLLRSLRSGHQICLRSFGLITGRFKSPRQKDADVAR